METPGSFCLRLQVRGRLMQGDSSQHTSDAALYTAYLVCHLRLGLPETSNQAAVLSAGTHSMLCVLLFHVQAAV